MSSPLLPKNKNPIEIPTGFAGVYGEKNVYLNKPLTSNFQNLKDTIIHFKKFHTSFSHPDFTVGFGISPNPALKRLAGLELLHHRRLGFTPDPEGQTIYNLQLVYHDKVIL